MDEQEVKKAIDAMVHFKHHGVWPHNLSDGMKALLSSIPLDPEKHSADFHCLVDPETGFCVICKVDHGDECQRCFGRGYHRLSCKAVDDFMFEGQ